jgi:hypothetical protein
MFSLLEDLKYSLFDNIPATMNDNSGQYDYVFILIQPYGHTEKFKGFPYFILKQGL